MIGVGNVFTCVPVSRWPTVCHRVMVMPRRSLVRRVLPRDAAARRSPRRCCAVAVAVFVARSDGRSSPWQARRGGVENCRHGAWTPWVEAFTERSSDDRQRSWLSSRWLSSDDWLNVWLTFNIAQRRVYTWYAKMIFAFSFQVDLTFAIPLGLVLISKLLRHSQVQEVTYAFYGVLIYRVAQKYLQNNDRFSNFSLVHSVRKFFSKVVTKHTTTD